MTIIGATEATHCHLEIAPFDANRLAIEQGIGYLPSGTLQHTMEGRA
jgi:hypothetical protein